MLQNTQSLHPIRAKLIFNPTSGVPGQSPAQLVEILTAMQAWNILPEVHIIVPNQPIAPVIRDASRRGVRLFVVSGGDGTIDSVAEILAGTWSTLGIIPTGTRNNIALSLGIPTAIPDAVALLRTGKRIKVDMGIATIGKEKRHFLEVCSIGLFSALFPAADDIQHGNLARIGDLLATLVSSPPARLNLLLNDEQAVQCQGYVILVGNMPFVGPHYPLSSKNAYADGLLDVFVFSNASKLNLLGDVVQMAGGSVDEQEDVHHYQVHSVQIDTDPPMPIIADGYPLGSGPLQIHIKRHTLAVMAPTSPALLAADEPVPSE